jgi:hypothetical protein
MIWLVTIGNFRCNVEADDFDGAATVAVHALFQTKPDSFGQFVMATPDTKPRANHNTERMLVALINKYLAFEDMPEGRLWRAGPVPPGKCLVKIRGIHSWADGDETAHRCADCGHGWDVPAGPRCCPKCRSPYWYRQGVTP